MVNNDGAFMEKRLKMSDGLTIYFREYGVNHADRMPVLCISGFWRNSRDFETLAPVLARKRRVIVPDMRGRGRSDYAMDVAQYQFERIVEDVWALLEYLKINRVAIIGGAMGGLIALEMAAKQPHRISGIIFNDVGPEREVAASKRMKGHGGSERLTREEVIERLRQQNKEFFPDFTSADWERFMVRAYRKEPDGFYIRDFDQKIHVATADLQARRRNFWHEFSSLGIMPIVILRGQYSDYLTPLTVEKMQRIKPGLKYVTVRGSGHPPQLDEIESITAIEALLKETDATIT